MKWCVVNREMMGKGVGVNAKWKVANFCRNMYHILMRASKNKELSLNIERAVCPGNAISCPFN